MGFLDTLGLEIEGGGFTKEDILSSLSHSISDWREYFNVANDASVQSMLKHVTPTINIFNHDFLSHKCGESYENEVMGYEITTLPLDFETLEKVIHKICNVLIRKGEIISPRSSTHIHIGFADNFNLLKSSFEIGLWIEPLMYKLAGMGGKFRGYINNSIYCRPLELGVGVNGVDNNYYNLLDPISVMESRDSSEFWKHYGFNGKLIKGDVNRYHPARYFGCNIFSLPLHGTLEFRYFNSTLNSKWILAVTRFCQAITELSVKVGSVWVQNLEKKLKSSERKSVLNTYYNTDYHEMLSGIEYMLDKHDIDFNTSREQRKTLRDIIENTETPIFSKQIPKTHLKDFRLLKESIVSGYHPRVDEVIESGFIDIHNIDNEYHSVVSED